MLAGGEWKERKPMMDLSEGERRERRTLLDVHLPYELTQLEAAYRLSCERAEDVRGKILKLMANDSFFLHARSLMEFFGKDEQKQASRIAGAWEFTNGRVIYPCVEGSARSVERSGDASELRAG